MEAYIEYVILDNFAIDLLILVITMKLLRVSVPKLRLIISSLIGTASAVIMPLIPYLSIAIMLRLVTAPIMCIVFKHKSIKHYVLFLLVMVVTTFAIGGTIMAIFNMSVSDNYILVYYPDKGIIGLSALAVMGVWYTLSQLTKSIKYRLNDKMIYSVKILSNAKMLDLRAYIDTGLKLYDSKGQPIIVASRHLQDRIILSSVSQYNITTNTIDGVNETICYTMEKLLIYYSGQVNTINNIGCIISKTNLNECDLLIHSELIRGGQL